jgi:hypothetical protein
MNLEFDWSGVMICPSCKCTSIHQKNVSVEYKENKDNEKCIMGNNSISVERKPPSDMERKNTTCILFSCDNGCKDFEVIIQEDNNKITMEYGN